MAGNSLTSKTAPGQRYGRLVAVERIAGPRNGWRYLCDCGQEHTALAHHVRRGLIQSCGCLQRESRITRKSGLIHGLCYSTEYRIWQAMKTRCYNPNHKHFRHYGGRGITVCEEWLNSFEKFYADVGPRPSPEYSLDRYPEKNGNYQPGNVRWATEPQQARNKQNNHVVSFQGRSMTLTEAAELYGKPADTIWHRLRMGWSVERALTEPIHAKLRRPV